MKVSVTDAKGQLTDLVRRAEAGEEIILTRHGQAATRRALIDTLKATAAGKVAAGSDAARSQDVLYEDDGLSRDPSKRSRCPCRAAGFQDGGRRHRRSNRRN